MIKYEVGNADKQFKSGAIVGHQFSMHGLLHAEVF